MALVRSQLENSTCVWSPHFMCHVNRTERVQRKFLQYIGSKLNIPKDFISYDELLSNLNLLTLKKRRENFDKIFIFKLINNHIDCSELLMLINIYVPPRILREMNTFCPDRHRTIYGQFSSMSRMMANSNLLRTDVFSSTLAAVKGDITSNL